MPWAPERPYRLATAALRARGPHRPRTGFLHAEDAMDVHVLNGEAWPQGGSAAIFWIAPLFFGGFIAVAFIAGILDVARRTWKRLRRR